MRYWLRIKIDKGKLRHTTVYFYTLVGLVVVNIWWTIIKENLITSNILYAWSKSKLLQSELKQPLKIIIKIAQKIILKTVTKFVKTIGQKNRLKVGQKPSHDIKLTEAFTIFKAICHSKNSDLSYKMLSLHCSEFWRKKVALNKILCQFRILKHVFQFLDDYLSKVTTVLGPTAGHDS